MRRMEVQWDLDKMGNERSSVPIMEEHAQKESLAEVAHDVRNLVTALGVYCDLLEEPGVLSAPFAHYGKDLRMVATASQQLAERLAAGAFSLTHQQKPVALSSSLVPGREEHSRPTSASKANSWHPLRWEPLLSEPINNLAEDLLANRNLLAALAGPAIALTIDTQGGALPVRLTGEELTRVLVNLVKNAAEAMPGRGRIVIRLHEFHAENERPVWLVLSVEDSGPGIPEEALEKIFEPGYSVHTAGATAPKAGRGLGLSSSRSIVEAAGGRIRAFNRKTPEMVSAGARFVMELPVREP
jgi:signal transduction histidine kinase